MKYPIIEKADEFQTDAQQSFFDTEAVQTAHPVVPLAQIDTTANPENHFRVPVRSTNSRFSPSMLALILLPALIALAGIGTLLYNNQAKNNSNGVPEINETVIQAEQINVEPPASKPAPVVSKNTLTQSQNKTSENKTDVEDSLDTEDSVPFAVILDESGRKVDIEKTDKEVEKTDKESEKTRKEQDEDDAPELKREDKENKKQEKLERKNKREKRQNRDSEKSSRDDNGR